MEKISSTFNFKALPGGFLAGLMLILFFEAVNFFFDDYLYPTKVPGGYYVKLKNEQVQKANDYDILIMGDCYISGALQPKIIQEKTGLTSYNFANQMAQTVLSTYAMFHNYLSRSTKKPRYLIVSFIPETSRMGRTYIEQQNIPYLYDVRKGNLSIFVREFGLANGLKLLIPSMKHQEFYTKHSLKEHFLNFKKGKMQRMEIAETMAKLDGWYPWNSDAIYSGVTTEAWYIKERRHDFQVSPFFHKYLQAILDEAYANNMQIIYLIPSRPQDHYDLDNKYGVTKKYSDFIKQLSVKYPQMIILNPQDLINNNNMYSDDIHLNAKGAQVLSEYISKYLAA